MRKFSFMVRVMIWVYLLYMFCSYNSLVVCRCLQVRCACCRWLVNWAVISARFLAGPCGQEEPLLAFGTGKYALCGRSPTSQPGNGSRESQGKTSWQSGRGERKIERQIIVLSYFVQFYLLCFHFTDLFISNTCLQPQLHLWNPVEFCS